MKLDLNKFSTMLDPIPVSAANTDAYDVVHTEPTRGRRVVPEDNNIYSTIYTRKNGPYLVIRTGYFDNDPDFDNSDLWQNIHIRIETDKFVILFHIDHSAYDCVHTDSVGNSDECTDFFRFNVHNDVYKDLTPTIEYINGGTEEDIILYILSM